MTKILFVDDDENIRLLYDEEFKEEGYDVHMARTGLEAVNILKEMTPDVIVMDIRMPEMDGLEAMTRIVSEHHNIPIIINSAYSHYRSDFSSWLADAYVTKSFDLTELKGTIKSVLSKPHTNV